MNDTYNPAWEYWGNGWPLDTWLMWRSTNLGDQLVLDFPDGLVGIKIDNAGQVDALAWAEAKHGRLPRTWSASYTEQFGVRVYRAPKGHRWGGDFVTGNLSVVWDGVLVAPSHHSDKYGRYLWHGPNGSWSGHPPGFEQIPELPAPWIPALEGEPMYEPPLNHDGLVLTVPDVVRKFVHSTVVMSRSRQDRMTTEELYRVFSEWREWATAPWISQTAFSRVLAADWEWNRWAGRIDGRFRRGYWGVRYPQQPSSFETPHLT